MHYILGIILRGSNTEIIEDESPLKKGAFKGFEVLVKEGERMIKQNPNIEQINFYQITQGQRILSYQMRSVIEPTEASS